MKGQNYVLLKICGAGGSGGHIKTKGKKRKKKKD